jgi:hypothetical protein
MGAKLNYTAEDCLKDFREVYEKHGISALNKEWLKNNGFKLHSRAEKLFKKPLETIAKELGVYDEYYQHKVKSYCESSNRECWTDEKIHKMALNVAGYKGFLSAIFRRGITIESISKKYHLTDRSRRTSRNGMLWDSNAECCCANFLWCRGIDITRGGDYPEEYKKLVGNNGRYDIQFKGLVDEFKDKNIKVEIWGNMSERYKKTREFKEEFHKDDPYFLGIQYEDCYNDKRLRSIFEKYIGDITPFRYVNETDKLVVSCHMSLIDEVLQKCRYITEHTTEHNLPPLAWFRKADLYKNRKIEDWEKLIGNLGNLSHDIQKVGGINLVRKLLENENVTKEITEA